MIKPKFVGLLSCSGEEIPEGTISRIATRKVLQELLPGLTTTVCVPLFLTGDEQERDFVLKYPCIAIDGCEKACVARNLKLLGKKPFAEVNLLQFFNSDELKEIKDSKLHDRYWKDHPYTQRLAEHLANLTAQKLQKINSSEEIF
ncbi:putative zinc-binding protein [Candidatus Harpocratesius sp.]